MGLPVPYPKLIILITFIRDEESKLEEYIKSIADAGVRCILSGGAFGEMAMHFIEKVWLRKTCNDLYAQKSLYS